MKREFPYTEIYNRFVELMLVAVVSITIFLKTCCLGKSTGISFIDSTPISTCKNKRIKRNKVLVDIAQVGKSTIGNFHNILLLMIKVKSSILLLLKQILMTGTLQNEKFTQAIKGKLYVDNGNPSKEQTQILFLDGLHLITSIKKNMKNSLMELKDKILLRKRSVIEKVNAELKNI